MQRLEVSGAVRHIYMYVIRRQRVNGPFVPRTNLWDLCCFTKVPDGPQKYTLDVLWLQEEGDQSPDTHV
jgi:hypothetical protein